MLNSPVDIAIIAGAILLLFGPKKLPEIGRALGQGIGNFKKSLTEAQEEVKSALKSEETPAGTGERQGTAGAGQEGQPGKIVKDA